MCQNRKWCIDVFGPTAQRAVLVSSRGTPAVLFLSSFWVFFVFSGATSAPCLIFIFPAIFYIRIVPKDREPLNSTPKILVRPSPHLPPFMCWLGRCCQTLSTRCACFAPPTLPPGCLLCCPWPILYGDESEFHHHRLVDGRWSVRQRPLGGAALMSVCSRKRGFASEEEHKPNDYLQE